MPKKSGFTLVELLVVVSIIAILSLIGLTIFTNVQKGARDARRKADVDSIVKAYEGKYQPLTGKYPALLATDFSAGKIPTPPEEGNYTGCSSSEVEGFKICASLESGGTFCQGSSQGTPPSSSTGTCGVVIAGGTPSPPAAPAAVLASKPLDCEIFGDMDRSGNITKNDSDILGSKLNTLSNDEKIIADVNYDGSSGLGTVDMGDLQQLVRYVIGDITNLTVCANAKPSPCGSNGDVTGDGKVTPMDAHEVLRIIAGGSNSLYTGQPYTDLQKLRADVNGSGSVTITDSTMILQYLDSTRTTFPACTSRALDCEIYGDVDRDNKLTTTDVSTISKYVDSLVVPTEDQKIIADVNYDPNSNTNAGTTVNSSDALKIQRYIDGLDTHLPICVTTRAVPNPPVMESEMSQPMEILPGWIKKKLAEL